MSLFKQKDDLSFDEIRNMVILKNHKFRCPTVPYEAYSKVKIQSVTFSVGVPGFLLQLNQMFHFQSFHVGIKVNVPCLAKNRIMILNFWSAVEEIVKKINIMRKHTRQAWFISKYKLWEGMAEINACSSIFLLCNITITLPKNEKRIFSSSLLTDTMLGQMVNCLHVLHDILLTIILVSKFNAKFFKPSSVHRRIRHPTRSRLSDADDSHNYFEKYGNYSDLLNRRGGDCQHQKTSQWTIFCFIMFEMIKHIVCQTSLSRILMKFLKHMDLKCHRLTAAEF